MRTAAELDAFRQLKQSPADLTDDQIAIFRDLDPRFGDIVERCRTRHRLGAAYQQRIAAKAHLDYERDRNRRRSVGR